MLFLSLVAAFGGAEVAVRRWRLVLGALSGAVSACAMPPTYVQTETYREPERSQIAEKVEYNAEQPSAEFFPNIESLLAYRRGACALPEQEQELLFREFRAERSDSSNLAILMLASCSPDQTPGLLADHLAKAGAMETGPSELQGLVELMSAQLRSYALVERRLRDTENRLERMITGLREIEAEMGGGDNGL